MRSASAGCDHSLVVSEEGPLYSFGSGGHGELGHGNRGGLRSPKMVNALRHVRIVAAAAGVSHSLALAEDGTVFSWGCNFSCQLGIGNAGDPVEAPQTIDALSGLQVCALAASKKYSCAVTATQESSSGGATEAVGSSGTATLTSRWCESGSRPFKMRGWLRLQLLSRTLGTPLKSRATAACLAAAKWTHSACQKPPPLSGTESMVKKCGAFDLRSVTRSCRACAASPD